MAAVTRIWFSFQTLAPRHNKQGYQGAASPFLVNVERRASGYPRQMQSRGSKPGLLFRQLV